MTDDEAQSATCRHCETELSGDDPTYRVLYGRFHHASEGVVSEKLVGDLGEELDPGADERWYCLDCYQSEFDRAKGAHFEFESAEELWSILDAADGRLVADAKPMTVGGRGWFRVVDGEVQARHAVRVKGGPDDDFDIGFDTEPTPDFGREEFDEFFDGDAEFRLIYLQPVGETPFVSGMNRTLGVEYDE